MGFQFDKFGLFDKKNRLHRIYKNVTNYNKLTQETRSHYILPALKATVRGVVEESRIREEIYISKGRLIGYGQRTKSDKAEYVLQ